jgi:hypothetical protein
MSVAPCHAGSSEFADSFSDGYVVTSSDETLPRVTSGIHLSEEGTVKKDPCSAEGKFDGLLMTIIDTHREAKRTRRLWSRTWLIIAMSIVAGLLGGWYRAAQAEPAQAYPGFKLAWDYEWAVPGDGFPIQINGKWAAKAAADAREIPVSDLNLSDGVHLIQVRARAADGRTSPWAGIEILYSSTLPEPLPAPDSMRIIMEWATQ